MTLNYIPNLAAPLYRHACKEYKHETENLLKIIGQKPSLQNW